jgi:DNA-binding HxlR family transcriptional regulator
MSGKDLLAMGQLLALLEARYAMRVIWALKDGRGQTFRLLQDSVGGITPNTLNTRVKELRDAGMLTHDQEGYRLTATGAELAKRIGDLSAFSAKWASGQSKSVK